MNIEEATEEFNKLYGPYFSYEEMKCHCNRCEDHRVVSGDRGDWYKTPEFKSFMSHLIVLRIRMGFPFHVNSGYRCPEYNNNISSTGLDGPHTKGATDIGVSWERMYSLVDEATTMKLGVGINQKGSSNQRFIHLDGLGRRLWSY